MPSATTIPQRSASRTAASLGVGSLALAIVTTLLALRVLDREAESDRARTRDRTLREVADTPRP